MIKKTKGILWDREDEMRRRMNTRKMNNMALDLQNKNIAAAKQNRNAQAQMPNQAMSVVNTPSKLKSGYGAMKSLFSGGSAASAGATSSAAPLAVNSTPAAAEMALAAQSTGAAAAAGTTASEGAILANAAHGANVGAASAAPAASGASSGAGGAGAAGGGAMATLGWVAAAIAAQNEFTNMTNRETDGVKTGNAFTGQYGTEPWYAYMNQAFGMDRPTAGEKFDAAVVNNDKSAMFKTAPAMTAYWADPATHAAGTIAGGAARKLTGSDKAGEYTEDIINPIGGILRKLW